MLNEPTFLASLIAITIFWISEESGDLGAPRSLCWTDVQTKRETERDSARSTTAMGMWRIIPEIGSVLELIGFVGKI